MARVATVFCLLLAIVAAAEKKKKPSVAARIVGGRRTEITEVPYTVSLQYKNVHDCGATIIEDSFVVTAAHCVFKGEASDYSVRVGSNNHANGGETRKIVKIMRHPNYDDPTLQHDIAVLKLEKPLKWKPTIRKIPLGTSEPKVGEDVLLSGWGVLEEKQNVPSSTLQSVVVKVVSREICKRIHRTRNTVTENMFCAGVMNGGKDACQGDSGGPAVIGGNLAGIISWGHGCGKRDSPGVYTAIYKYREWIQQQTR